MVDLEHVDVLLDVGAQRIDLLEEAFTRQVHAEVAELQWLQLEVLAQLVVAGAQHAFVEEGAQRVLGVLDLFDAVVGGAGFTLQVGEETFHAAFEGLHRGDLAATTHDQGHADEVLDQVLERRFVVGGRDGALLQYGFGHLSTAISSSLRLVKALGA
ncbi:hypothetical protein D3C85_1416690 [compost metagenome]